MARILVLVGLLGVAEARLSASKSSLKLEHVDDAVRQHLALAVGPEKSDPTTREENSSDVTRAAGKAPKPMFSEKTMPAVSPTLRCVMTLSIQYFIVYTLLAVVRTINDFRCTRGRLLGVQRLMESACLTITYAPMLSVLFLGARMRAIQLTQGETEKYQLPQPWVQKAMWVCVCAVLGQLMLLLVVPICTKGLEGNCDEGGDIDMDKVKIGGTMYFFLCSARHLLIVILYGSFTVVIAGIFMMEPPKEIWGDSAPPVSPAVLCTIILATLFLFVYLLVAWSKMSIELNGHTDFQMKLQCVLTEGRYTVNLAPMLAILFIGARMRALQIDPKRGNPQRWAQMFFYACTASIAFQMLLVILVPFCVQCRCNVGERRGGTSEGDVIFDFENRWVSIIFTATRYVALLVLYVGVTAVIASVFLISHPTDVSLTPPISPAMKCVMNLTVQFFTIYLMFFISVTVQQLARSESIKQFMQKIIPVCEGAIKTVMFAPMLSILFVGTRMRALQLTKATDGTIPRSAGPQSWVQDAMFVATWSVLVQMTMVMFSPIITWSTPEMDHSGNVKAPESSNSCVKILLEVIRYISLIAMYGAIVTIMVGVFLMTPETLPPYSNMPGYVPQPPAAPTRAEAAR